MHSLSFVSCEGSHLGIKHDVRLWCEVSQEVRQTEGISEKQKQNKNIPLTGLQRRQSHSGTALWKKKKSTITSRFVLGSAGGSKEEWWMAMRLSSRPMFTGRPFVPTHLASSSLKEARRFLATSQTTLLWGGSNSCFTLGSSLPRKTKNTSLPSETAGRAEH